MEKLKTPVLLDSIHNQYIANISTFYEYFLILRSTRKLRFEVHIMLNCILYVRILVDI